MTADAPFVQMKSFEIVDKLPMLSGFFAQVFLTIGAFEADPIGLSAKDLFRFLGLSRPSVAKALEFLEHHELIKGEKDDEGTTRYRACFGFYYRGASQVNLRENVPEYEHVKTVFTPSRRRISTDSNSDFISSSSNTDALKILRDAGVMADRLTIPGMTEERASTIAAYIRRNPDQKTSAAAWVYVCLQRDSAWMPSRKAQVETVGESLARMRAEGLIK